MKRALIAVTNLLGAAAFLYPFFLGAAPATETQARASDAPYLFAAFGALLVAIALSDARAGRLDAKRVALLGILSGVNAMLRLPGSIAGANLMFALPILGGYAFGPSFGFMLGATSMAASGLITGGVGPWLPFQMWALGWVGGGAGLMRAPLRGSDGRAAVLALAAYGWVAGLAFGALTNLWFWPFQQGASDVAWIPGLGARAAAARYWRFYLATSLAWDSARAVANVVLVAVLGRPVVRLLGRFRERMLVEWDRAGPGTMAA